MEAWCDQETGLLSMPDFERKFQQYVLALDFNAVTQ